MVSKLPLLCAALASTTTAVQADISASSKAGMRLLSTSRRVENNNDEEDMSWIGSYSIKYVGCQHIVSFGGEGAGREMEEFTGSKVFNRQLVRFRLCPSDTCERSCGGGAEYITDLAQFVEAYSEAKREALEYACQQVEANCDCEDADDNEGCLNQCYAYAELEDCIEDDGNDDGNNNNNNQREFEINEFLECRAIEDGNDDYPEYFMGATCSNNKINLGVFHDAACTKKADPSIYSSYNYGAELPYTKESIVKYDCIPCANQNDGDDDGVEISEMCDRVYEEAAKCEKKLDGKTSELNKSDCKFIHNTVFKLAHPGRNIVATVFACIFAITTAALGYYAYTLHQKMKRSTVKLADEGAIASPGVTA